jgi:4-amino-4-deoxy-L-arabinose transferase-like glycosyltransferase
MIEKIQKYIREKMSKTTLLFLTILTIGVFARIWEFGKVPPGLHVDEASSGVEAYYLYKYGVDRNNISYPVNFIAWQTGQQNALYAYLLIPFIALGGLDPFFIRLPMMLSGILSLPIMYFVGKRLGGGGFGLLCMFLMTISPWHIVNTRWAVESNILPFLFLVSTALLLVSSRNNSWFIVAGVFLATCLYAYGTAYASVPIFLSLSVLILFYYKRIRLITFSLGLISFLIISLPIFLFIIINTFNLETIHWGLITIPHNPVEARFQYMTAIFNEGPLKQILQNAGIMLRLLWGQSDGLQWNYVEPFGYFYKITFPLILTGLFLMIPLNSKEKVPERWIIVAWIFASICIGLLHPVNLTRINIIFTPLLICFGWFLTELNKRFKYIFVSSIILLIVSFILFNAAYHGKNYRQIASGVFNAGIIPAIEYASQNTREEICLTDQVYFDYIYILYTQKPHPTQYVNNIDWGYTNDPEMAVLIPRNIKNFSFIGYSCSNSKKTTYILSLKELPPNNNLQYKEKHFTKFKVLIPKQ